MGCTAARPAAEPPRRAAAFPCHCSSASRWPPRAARWHWPASSAPTTALPLSSVGLEVVLATVIFCAPVGIWLAYSREVTSAGGLFSFVEAVAGRRVALVQGAVWTISYFLYLPYTVTYVVYDTLPAFVPGINPYRPRLEVALPIALAAVGFFRVRGALYLTAVLAVGQLAVLVAFAAVGMGHFGAPAGAFSPHGAARHIFGGTVNFSLLYICVSLPLYLGGEVKDGSRTVRRGLAAGFGLSAAFVLLGLLVWARAGNALAAAEVPGFSLAQQALAHWFGVVVGVGVAVSIVALIIAEYLGLSRLLHAMSGKPLVNTTAWVAVAFVVADVISLVNPDAFYNQLIKPSLVALWVSQIPVFVLYPLLAWRRGARSPGRFAGAIVVAGGATALMAYGLYTAVLSATSS